MLDSPQSSSSQPAPLAAEDSSNKFGRCIITNEFTSHRWYPKRPKSDQQFAHLRNTLGEGNYGSPNNEHHFMFVREDWDRLYSRGWWLLVPSRKLVIALSTWSRPSARRWQQGPCPNITELYGGEQTFQYRLVPNQPMLDAGFEFPRIPGAEFDDEPFDDPKRNASNQYRPRFIHLPIHPHLVVASNGILYKELHFSLAYSLLPGLGLSLSAVNYWLDPSFGRHWGSVEATITKRRRSSSPHSDRVVKRPTVIWSPSDDVWRKEPDFEDSISSEGDDIPERIGLRLQDEEGIPQPPSIAEWRPFGALCPASPPASPVLTNYREEPAFSPPESESNAWHQSWRDVVVRSDSLSICGT